MLAGYTIVECESFERATEIAARVSQCPPGRPSGAEGQNVDVRPILVGTVGTAEGVCRRVWAVTAP